MAAQHLISLQREPGLLERLSTNALRAQKGKYTYYGAADAWADALNRCMATPVKVDRNFKPNAERVGRTRAWGLPGAIADRVRWWLGREAIPLDPGDEWPHGCVPVPLGEKGRLESWAAELENRREGARSARIDGSNNEDIPALRKFEQKLGQACGRCTFYDPRQY